MGPPAPPLHSEKKNKIRTELSFASTAGLLNFERAGGRRGGGCLGMEVEEGRVGVCVCVCGFVHERVSEWM